MALARKRERELKGKTRAKKEALILNMTRSFGPNGPHDKFCHVSRTAVRFNFIEMRLQGHLPAGVSIDHSSLVRLDEGFAEVGLS